MMKNRSWSRLLLIVMIAALLSACSGNKKSKDLTEGPGTKSGDEIYKEHAADSIGQGDMGTGEAAEEEMTAKDPLENGSDLEDEDLYNENGEQGESAYEQDMTILGDLELEEGEALIPISGKDIPFQGSGPGDEKPDWDSLEKDNPDIVAWIVIPGTDISQPVFQRSGDQTYYDKHGADGGSSKCGALHLDIGNLSGFDDPNTIIYGCDINNSGKEKGPFASLKAYKDLSFLEKNRYIYVYTPLGEYEFCIFAAYSGSETDILTKVNGFDFYVFTDYINSIYDDNSLDAITDPALQEAAINGWRLLTLSGGPFTDSTDRFFVQATFSGSRTYQ